MRYSTDHKEETHRRIIEVAAKRFRTDGIDNVGVASLMGDAGLTHGGFYSHFKSKDALVAEVIESGMNDSYDRISAASKDGGIEAFIRTYLRPENLEHPERGCPAAALGSELRRQPKPAREAFTRKYKRITSHIESLLPPGNIQLARAIFATLAGSLQLARTVPDPKLASEILASGQSAATTLARSAK